MISKAKEYDGILFTSNWNEVVSEIKKYKSPAINLSSVIHEVYSYSHGSIVKKFWEQQIFSNKFKYIIIRDMIPSVDMGKSESFKNDVRKIKLKSDKFCLNSFENKWGKISDNYRTLTHFLLKYKFIDNWEREVNENYLPISLETLKNKIPKNYSIIYENSFILPYLKEQVMKDFNIDLIHTTHTKMIIKNNIKLLKESIADTFSSSTQYLELCQKYKIDKDEVKEYFTDITDNFHQVAVSNSYITYNTSDLSHFTIQFTVSFSISTSDKVLNIVNYIKLLEKQIDDLELIKQNCNRFSEMEGYTVVKSEVFPGNSYSTTIAHTSKINIDYKFTKIIYSDEMMNARNNYLKSITTDEKNINNCVQKIVDKLIEKGIAKAERLVDIHPGHEEMETVIFGFLTNSEIITIAEYDKKDKTLHFDKNGINSAIQAYIEDECDEYL